MVDDEPIRITVIPPSMLKRWDDALLLDLTAGNYRKWKKELHEVLSVCDTLDMYTSPSYACPPRATRLEDARKWVINDRHVQAFIRLQCSENEREHLPAVQTASELYAFLAARHLNRGTHTQVFLLRDLLALRFDQGQALAPQAQNAIRICRQVIAMGPLTADALGKVVLLNMMDGALDTLQSQVANDLSRATKASPYSVADILQRLEVHHDLTAGKATSAGGLSTDVALSAQTGRGGRSQLICSNCKRKGHAATDCFQPGGVMEGKRAEVEARIAARKVKGASKDKDSGKAPKTLYDHEGRAYFLAEPAPSSPPVVDAAHTAVSDPVPLLTTDGPDPSWLSSLDSCGDSAYEAYLACSAPLVCSLDWDSDAAFSVSTPAASSEPFLFDSGASTHVSPLRSDFTTLTPISPHGIRGVNGSIIYAVGIGQIHLTVGRGKRLTLEHALYVPNATVRLISVRALCDGPHAYRVDFAADGVTVRHRSGALFFTGRRVNRGLYALSGPAPEVSSALVSASPPTLETWHRCLGHANYRATYTVAKAVHASGTPVNLSSHPPKCDACIRGKQTRTPVPSVREGERSKERGGTFFLDAAGTQCTTSASGNVCPLDIIDDFSSYAWTFPVPSKAHCAPTLRDFIVARRAEGCPVRKIVMDRGECLTEEIKAVCRTLGVAWEITAPHTSAHNGKAERIHRTFLGKSRAMRLSAGVPENRWDEFYVTACYLSNRTPSASLPRGVTPYEAWFGHPPSLRHLREIGCRAFVLINTHNPKLRPRSFECVLIGYGQNSKTYRCYHVPTRRVLESYHVSFIESHESPPPPSASTSSPSSSPDLVDDPSPSPINTDWPDDPPFTPTMPHTCPAPPPSLLPVPPAPVSASSAVASPVSQDPVTVPPADVEPRRSSRVHAPSERRAAAEGLPYITTLERAVAECKASSERARSERDARTAARSATDSSALSDLDHALAATLQLDHDYAGDPTSLKEALSSAFSQEWTTALKEEFASIKELGVYKLIPRRAVPYGRRIMHGKPVFRLKRDEHGNPVRFKARWVCKGYEAVWGQDYNRTTSPTMRMESFRVLLHLAASLNWELLQVDVKTAFLYGLLPDDEVCYMEQPQGFEEPRREDWVWELHKGLYGMPQGGRTWNRTMHSHLVSAGFTRIDSEYCIYYRTSPEGTVITGVHVDDFLAIASSPAAGALFKADLRRAWTISDLGEARFCIGIAIERDRATRTIRISQTALIDRVITQFGLADAHPVATPMETTKLLAALRRVPRTKRTPLAPGPTVLSSAV
ncbi:hypothetical protein BN946_scf184753.g1 [Trametes cinnabarina]|uniref:Integrase catalytic domain-containing protein n=1 Tax=Pycnoporus cinnabarinus TaxID=5643 RepID=A0A060SSX7_PYCCI|nr:hypothetical protein BN946_scf184753.g1 [Trametes cinnabarina]